ncbi:hypothetical protein EJ06DRAFT_526476 [Trichodelitschia bisporula]|uniref:Uncharacterized protein n=1 Tax=Trichodelitschia bisporula TaxID=703511 RepID=A0A6G1I8J6_9PEZI|nr:hypothetical protein EJ06DRAFT_526476 [Trichodelitschia bisporula]
MLDMVAFMRNLDTLILTWPRMHHDDQRPDLRENAPGLNHLRIVALRGYVPNRFLDYIMGHVAQFEQLELALIKDPTEDIRRYKAALDENPLSEQHRKWDTIILHGLRAMCFTLPSPNPASPFKLKKLSVVGLNQPNAHCSQLLSRGPNSISHPFEFSHHPQYKALVRWTKLLEMCRDTLEEVVFDFRLVDSKSGIRASKLTA